MRAILSLIIRRGFGDILYCNYYKEPQNPILIIKGLGFRV